MKEQRRQTVKVRIYPTKEQQVLINKHFGCARFVFNYFLNQKKERYLQFGKSLEDYIIKRMNIFIAIQYFIVMIL